MPRKKVRAPPRASPRAGLNTETAAGFVVAAGAGLLLTGILHQNLVGAGIAASLLGLQVYVALGLIDRTIRRPARFDAAFLGLGIVLALPAAILRGGLFVEASILALASAVCFAWLTRRLLGTPQRILIPVAVAIPLVGHGIAAALDPTVPTALPWLIGILAALPWPAAVASADILRRRSATVMRHQVARAEQNLARKDYERSLAEYDRAIARTAADIPGAEIPWYGKGATLILLGRYGEAVRAIDKALDINPRNEVAWVNKGNALTRMGQPIDALRCFNAAIKVNPLYEVAWNNKGNALARLGRLTEALHCYERALGIDPGYRGAWVNMGFVLTKLGRFDEAASCADQALRLQPSRRAEPT